MAAIRAATEGILREQQSQPEVPQATVRSQSISSVGPAFYASPEQMCIIGMVLSADTAGRYAITVENDTSDWFRIPVNTPINLGYDESRPLIVPRGLRLTVTPTGSPAWDLIFWWVPGLARGRVS